MRKNKTSLTAHHFMSAPSDSPLVPHLVACCFTGTSSKCIPLRLLRPVFFFPPWPVTDSWVQSINLSQPQSGPVLCGATYGQNAHTTAHIPGSVMLNGINIWQWIEREIEREKNGGQFNLPSVCHTLIPCHRLTSAKPSKWNSRATFEYKEWSTSVGFQPSGWVYLPTDSWTH